MADITHEAVPGFGYAYPTGSRSGSRGGGDSRETGRVEQSSEGGKRGDAVHRKLSF